MRYLVFYTENCTPHIKVCKSDSEAKRFITLFRGKHEDNKDDNWVDVVIKGDIIREHEGLSGIVVKR